MSTIPFFRKCIVLIGIWAGMGTVIYGQLQNHLPDYYETATVKSKKTGSAAASVTVLDKADIDSFQATHLGDLLPHVAGVTLIGGGTRGSFTTAQMRGGDPNFTLVLLDGVPMNDPTYQVGDAFDLAGFPVAGLARIEIVRGPLSSFFGATGLAGVINLITESGGSSAPRSQFEVQAGNHGFQQGSGQLSGNIGTSSYWLMAGFEEEDGAVAQESFEDINFHGRLMVPLTADQSLGFSTRLGDWSARDYPDASGGPVFGDGALRDSDHREINLAANWQQQFSDGRLHKIGLAYYRHQLDRDSPAVGFLVPESSEDVRFSRMRLSWQSVLHQSDRFRISAGLDAEREDGDNSSVLLLPGFSVPGDYAFQRDRGGAFAEVVYEKGRLLFEFGSRFDVSDDHATQWSPRLGASFGLNPDTRLRISAGRAFKLPSFFALASPGALGGNPDLRPEKALGGDLGMTHRFAESGWQMGLTYFRNRFEDLVDFDFDLFTHLNRSRVDSEGFEYSLAWNKGGAFSADLQATWQQTRDPNSDQPLRHRPKWSGAGRLAWRPHSGWFFQADARALSQSADQQIPVQFRFVTPGYTVFGISASKQIFPRWHAKARVDNLTDKTYESLIGFPGPERSFRLGIRFSADR